MSPLFSHTPTASFAQRLEDPDFLFMVGRAIGNMERVAHWLMQQEQPPEAKSIGESMLQVAAWFYQDSSERPPAGRGGD